ncbi:outer membrane efflux protein [Hallella multisaccharivorax DSM 17128]|uniref:Outer membrane efflux protein n=1 Tax=Hallella multisaccharivorax DSM 17128 TaxID=688246 RepID=F8N6D8_9BACT|nr:TolC family protein [Hallella multisaccharivorax]EGN57243.1 outer membrane efflux protein [Hallella multisaccharivorax DSM 17128]
MKNKILCTIVLIGLLSLIGASKVMAQDSLSTYIAAAIRNNPAVIGSYQAYKAQVMSACGTGVLGDPTLQVGVFPKSMQHVNGKQIAIFTIMQMFPWFGTLKTGRENMEYKAESTYQKFRADGIALAYEVQRRWYDMLATQEKIKAVKGKLGLLEDIKKLALLTYKTEMRARNAKMSDQLRLDAEEQSLREQAASLDDGLRLQRQQFNIVMHREADAPLVIPDTIILREMPTYAWTDIETADPVLQKSIADGKAFDAQERLADKMGKPTFSVGLQYMLNGKVKRPVMENMNGMDMIMPMVTVSLPIYRRKTNMSKEAAKLNKLSTDETYRSRQDALKSEYLSIEQRAADARRKVELYDKEVEILNHTLQLMNTEYATGTTTLTDILETNRQYIDYALKKAEAYATFNTIVAEYEKMASRYDYAVRANTKQ